MRGPKQPDLLDGSCAKAPNRGMPTGVGDPLAKMSEAEFLFTKTHLATRRTVCIQYTTTLTVYGKKNGGNPGLSRRLGLQAIIYDLVQSERYLHMISAHTWALMGAIRMYW